MVIAINIDRNGNVKRNHIGKGTGTVVFAHVDDWYYGDAGDISITGDLMLQDSTGLL